MSDASDPGFPVQRPWDARLARRLVAPLRDTWVVPNHPTTARWANRPTAWRAPLAGLPPEMALAHSLAKRAREILLGIPGLLYLHLSKF